MKCLLILVFVIGLVSYNGYAAPFDDDEYPNDSDYSENDDDVRTACVVKENYWKICKECDPAYAGSKECSFSPITECKCMNIIVNGKGGSDCMSEENGIKWCYVDSSSSCSDKSKSGVEKPRWVDNELYYSEEACQNFNQEAFDKQEAFFGNQPFLDDIALKDEDLSPSLGGNGFKTETPEHCQAECLARDKICFGWTFDDYKENEGQGTCYLKGSQICCNQNKKKVVKEGAISGFICDNCNKNCTSCWSTFGACPCSQEVERFDPNFGAGGTNLTAFSASAGLAFTKRNCEYARVLYRFIRGRWRPVERIGTDKATCQ